jgi:hypothetical protein
MKWVKFKINNLKKYIFTYTHKVKMGRDEISIRKKYERRFYEYLYKNKIVSHKIYIKLWGRSYVKFFPTYRNVAS